MRIKAFLKDLNFPEKSYLGDAGYDVFSPENGEILPGEIKQIKLGFAVEIEQNEVIIMSERSGQALKYGITSIGNVIDSGYRGEISIILLNTGKQTYKYNKGDKIGQLLILNLGNQTIKIEKELSATERGSKAHYSSGT